MGASKREHIHAASWIRHCRRGSPRHRSTDGLSPPPRAPPKRVVAEVIQSDGRGGRRIPTTRFHPREGSRSPQSQASIEVDGGSPAADASSEVMPEVANQEPNGVADLAVGLPRHVKKERSTLMSFSNGKEATHQRQTSAPYCSAVHRRRGHSPRLAHLATVFVDHEAMGQDGFVRGHARHAQCGQQ